MDTIFKNSENSKTSKPHVLILKLTNKLDLIIVMFLIMIISKIQEYYIRLFQTNRLLAY